MKKFFTALLALAVLCGAGVFGKNAAHVSAEDIQVNTENAQSLNGYKNFQKAEITDEGWLYETTTITDPAVSLKESQYIDLSDGKDFSISFSLPFYDANNELVAKDVHKQNVALVINSIETGRRLYCYIYTVNFLDKGVTNGAVYMRDKGGALWVEENFATKEVTYAANARVGEEFSFKFNLDDFFYTIPHGEKELRQICPKNSEGHNKLKEFFAGTKHISFLVALMDGGKSETDARGKILVTEFCGQSLKSREGKLNITVVPDLYELYTYNQPEAAGENPAYAIDEPLMVALTGNYTYLDTPANFKKGKVTRIPEVYGYTQEIIGGIKEIKVKAYAPDGTTIAVPNIGDWNYEFTPAQAGVWKIGVQSIGYGGESAERFVTVTIKQIYKIVVDGSFENSYGKGSAIVIPSAYTVDEKGNKTDDEVKVVVKNPFAMEETISDGKITADISGVYTVTYSAVNPEGKTIETEFRLTVSEVVESNDGKGGCGSRIANMTALAAMTGLTVIGVVLARNKEDIR